MTATDKDHLRRDLRKRLRGIEEQARQASAEAVVGILSRQFDLKHSRIAAYWPGSSEFDCRPLVWHCQRRSAQVYLPAAMIDGQMTFRLLAANEPSSVDAMGIPCPPVEARTIDRQNMDMALLPLVGFDDRGHRLGTGGGYYDRYFAAKIGRPESAPCLIGLAFEQQECPKIPQDSHDVPLDAVLTPERLIDCSSHLTLCSLFKKSAVT